MSKARLRLWWMRQKSNFRYWWQRQKEAFPLVSRKWHGKELSSKLDHQRTVHRQELAKAVELADKVLAQGVKVEAYQDTPFEIKTYVTLDPSVVYRAMADKSYDFDYVRFIAHRLAIQVEQQIATIDFATIRPYREEWERRQRERYYPPASGDDDVR